MPGLSVYDAMIMILMFYDVFDVQMTLLILSDLQMISDESEERTPTHIHISLWCTPPAQRFLNGPSLDDKESAIYCNNMLCISFQ